MPVTDQPDAITPDPEAPAADAIEQARPWSPDDDDLVDDSPRLAADVPEPDARDQARPIPLDDEP